tara:strand:- start:4148 stop:4708 length:561 start_codon:yes stop_codon:yes gene_type:complete
LNPDPLFPAAPGPLDLTRAPSILFFFGLSGSGKSYVGDIIGRYGGWEVYHADDDITPEMRSALSRAEPFTHKMRAAYISALIDKIRERRLSAPRLVVTQGVYKQRHRDHLLASAPDMELIWVTAPDTLINERIARRSSGIAIESAAALKADFEVPPPGIKTIRNDADDLNIIDQLNRFFSAAAPSG